MSANISPAPGDSSDSSLSPVLKRPFGSSGSRLPRWVGPAYILMGLILVPWIVYLQATLPLQEVSQHYRLAWVGLDILEFGQLTRTGLYALVRRWRHRMRPHAAACAAMLIVDAWFDVTTTPTNQVVTSIATAVLVELPLAGLCWWLALREPHPSSASTN